MARKSEKFVVDDEHYECTQLPATKGLEVYHSLLGVVMPALRELVKNAPEFATGDNQTAAFVLIASTVEKVPWPLLRDTAATFAETCTHKRGELWVRLSPAVFDEHFAGRMPHLMRWLFACMRINFQDFLGGLVGSNPAAAAQ